MEEHIGPALPEQPPPPSLSEWSGIWFQAVTKPSEETYIEIARRADVKTAYIWLAISYLISNMVSLLIIGLSRSANGYSFFNDFGYDLGGINPAVANLCCGLPLNISLGIALLSGMAALSNVIARGFGGVGDYRQLIYCFAAYNFFLPAVSTAAILSSQIIHGGAALLLLLLGYAVIIYDIVLNVRVIKAVHQIKTSQAITSSFLLLAIFACVVLVILVMLGPAVGNLFSTIIVEVAPGC